MEAPEKVHVFVCHNEDLEVYEMPLKTLNGTLITVEYTRSDLCTMPAELVERMRRYLAIENYRDINIVEIAEEIIRDNLAWHEGRKG